jgi:hypothetical protein
MMLKPAMALKTMKVSKDFSFRGQINGKHYYARVTLEVEKLPITDEEQGELLLKFDYEDEHNDAVQLGATYFFKRYTEKHSVDMLITVLRIGSMLVDTSASTIFYATIMALSEALSFQVEGFILDKQTGIISFSGLKEVGKVAKNTSLLSRLINSTIITDDEQAPGLHISNGLDRIQQFLEKE